MEVKQVEGRDAGKVFLYALSTCAWCKKTKKFLKKLGVAYSYVDVDLEADDGKEATESLRPWNPRCNFPTLVINDEECIVGFKEDDIRRLLGG